MQSTWWTTVGALTLLALPLPAQENDRIWGRVTTAAGQVYEGFIRWDRNEGSWADLLNGSKELDDELMALVEDVRGDERRDERSIEFLGFRISWNDDDDRPSSAESGIRFGHLRSLRVTGDDRARLLLKSGEEIEMYGGSTDLGDDMREFVVDDPQRGVVELEWRDLDRIDFASAPAGARPSGGERLYGTVEDRWGNRYTGFVSWDLDEILGDDVLDGEERGRDREIPFRLIEGIERDGSRASRVFLRNGDEVVLSGSNDVASGHRGVQVTDPSLGQVEVEWAEFRSVAFHDADQEGSYDRFDGGHRLYGTVTTDDGESFTGWIVWDADEAWSWEILDGQWRDLQFDVEFGEIDRIEKRGSRSAEVVLLDGRSFELEGSNDVDRDNKGIVIDPDGGEPVVVDWDRFREVVFQHR